MSEQYQMASDFRPLPGEANFPPPIELEVRGGMHLAPECITIREGRFVMVEWPNGLPRHDSERSVRFPHGLMHFGETVEDCAARLVGDQMGLSVDAVRSLRIYSYLDDMNHWHVEPLLEVRVNGEPSLPAEASRVVEFDGRKMPEGSVWGEGTWEEVFDEFYGGA